MRLEVEEEKLARCLAEERGHVDDAGGFPIADIARIRIRGAERQHGATIGLRDAHRRAGGGVQFPDGGLKTCRAEAAGLIGLILLHIDEAVGRPVEIVRAAQTFLGAHELAAARVIAIVEDTDVPSNRDGAAVEVDVENVGVAPVIQRIHAAATGGGEGNDAAIGGARTEIFEAREEEAAQPCGLAAERGVVFITLRIMPGGAGIGNVPRIHCHPGAGPCGVGAVELLRRGIAASGLPHIELAAFEAIALDEVRSRRGALLANIKVKRPRGCIIAQKEGHMRRGAGIDQRGIFPRTATHVRQSPKIAIRGIERPHGAAVRMTKGGRGFLTHDVNAIHEAPARAPEIRLEQSRGAGAVEAAEFELSRAGDHRARAVIHACDSQAAIHHTA